LAPGAAAAGGGVSGTISEIAGGIGTHGSVMTVVVSVESVVSTIWIVVVMVEVFVAVVVWSVS
jgi:hypothetical protein